MNSQQSNALMSNLIKRMKEEVASKNLSFSASNLSGQSEITVKDLLDKFKQENIFNIDEIIFKENSHQFPDIIVKFDQGYSLGIEVKSSSTQKSGWSINGNSIVGSTSVDVDETYIIFIKFNSVSGFDVRYALYQDSISDVVVTHSPRYKIDLEMAPENSFFHKSGISYENIKNADEPIALIKKYFVSQGKTAWWIDDHNDDEASSATVRSWNDLIALDNGIANKAYGEAFILFPEIINGPQRSKYNRLAKWLAVKYSVADSSLRDKFSAGGKVQLTFNNQSIDNAPQVYCKLTIYKESIKAAFSSLSLNELQDYWTGYTANPDNLEARKQYWLKALIDNEISEDLLTYTKSLLEIDIP